MQKILVNINRISVWATIVFLLSFLLFTFLGVVLWGVGSPPEWWQILFYVILYTTGIICIVSYLLGLVNSIRESKLIHTIVYLVVLLFIFTSIYVQLFVL